MNITREQLIEAGLLIPAPDNYVPKEVLNLDDRPVFKIGEIYGWQVPRAKPKPNKRQRRRGKRRAVDLDVRGRDYRAPEKQSVRVIVIPPPPTDKTLPIVTVQPPEPSRGNR